MEAHVRNLEKKGSRINSNVLNEKVGRKGRTDPTDGELEGDSFFESLNDCLFDLEVGKLP
jgi:hypothetical protein